MGRADGDFGKRWVLSGVLCVPREAGGGWGCADLQTLRDPEGFSLPRVPQLRRGGSGGLRTPPRGHRGRGVAVPGRGGGRTGTAAAPAEGLWEGEGEREGEGQLRRFPRKAAGDRTVSQSVTTPRARKLSPRFLPGRGEGKEHLQLPFPAVPPHRAPGTGHVGAEPSLEPRHPEGRIAASSRKPPMPPALRGDTIPWEAALGKAPQW